MNPRVSIAIPCYNAGRWIATAVQSALDQTWTDKEIIVVDDGSTDGSPAILQGFGDAIRVFHAAHRGGNHARNHALAHATGEWMQFLDADDFLLPEKISRQFAEVTDADVIFSPVLFDQEGRRTASKVDPQRDPTSLWLAWELPQTGGCLWRRSTLESLGGWNEATGYCQEYELYLRAIEAGLRFGFAPTPNAVYRVWSDATLCRKNPAQVIEVRTQLFHRLIAWLRREGRLADSHLRLAGQACLEMSRTLAKTDLRGAAQYHRARKSEGLIHLAGPAAPLSYRVACHTLGFSAAEKLAAAWRPARATGTASG